MQEEKAETRFLLSTNDFRLFLGLFPLGAVLGAALLAVFYAGSIQRTAHDVVTHARKVFHTTAADEYDAVLLKVMAFTGDVGDHLNLVGEAHLSHLTEGGIRLLRRGGIYAGANATALRTGVQRTAFALDFQGGTSFADKLLNSRHCRPFRKRYFIGSAKVRERTGIYRIFQINHAKNLHDCAF